MANTLRELIVSVSADTRRYQAEMQRVSRMGGQYFRSVQTGAADGTRAWGTQSQAVRHHATAIDASSQALGRYVAAAAGAFGVSQLVQSADKWTDLNNKLRLVTNSTGEFKRAQEEVGRIANTTYQDMGATASVYQKIAMVQERLGITSSETARIVETVNKTIAMSGSSTAAAAGAMTQLGQAFASGTLRAEEFNSIMEGAPALAIALEKGMGLAQGSLRQMVVEGKVSSQDMTRAILKMSDDVDASFGKIQPTIRQSMTVLDNEFTKFIGKSDEAGGASAQLSNAIGFLAQNMEAIATVGGAAAMGALAGKMVQMGLAAKDAAVSMVQNRAAAVAETVAIRDATLAAQLKAQADVRKAQAAMVSTRGTAESARASAAYAAALLTERNATAAATAAQVAYARATSAASLAGRAALGLLGGPAGLALTVGVVAAGFLALGDSTESAGESLLEMSGTVDEVVAKFRELGAAQRELQMFEAEKKIEDASEAMASAITNMGGHAHIQSLDILFKQIDEQFKSGAISAEQGSQRISEALARIKPYSEGIREDLIRQAASWEDNAKKVERGREVLDAMRGSQDGTAASTAKLTEAAAGQAAQMGQSSEKWAEYIGKLEDAAETIGLNAQQLAEYRAKQAGFSDEQAQLAGVMAAKAAALTDFQQAIQNNDKAQADAAQRTLERLAGIEDGLRSVQGEALVAVDNITQMFKAMAGMAGGLPGINAPLPANQLWMMNPGEKPMGSAQAGLGEQLAQIRANATVKTPSRKSGGSGGSKRDEWGDWKREIEQSIKLQEALAGAYGKGAAAVDAANQAHEVELAVLKLGAGKREEIVALMEREAAAKRYARGEEMLAGMEKEIALYGAVGREAQTAYDIAHGALARYDEKQKAALLEASKWLDWLDEMKDIEQAWGDIANEVEGAAEKAQGATDRMSTFAEQAGRNIQSYLGDATYNLLDGKYDDIADSFSDMLKRMLAELAASQLLEMLGGAMSGYGGQGAWGNFIRGVGGAMQTSGGRAGGGTVQPFKAYDITEHGSPEVLSYGSRQVLLMGAQGGVVSPLKSIGGGGGAAGPMQVVINNNGNNRVQAREETGRGADGGMLRRMVIDIVGESLNGGQLGAVGKARYGWKEAI